MNDSQKIQAIVDSMEDHMAMVLSTSVDSVVSSRTMSVVRIGSHFYFQTDRTMDKYSQLMANPHVSLCKNELSIVGIARDVGHPEKHPAFCEAFSKAFPGSFNAYSHLSDERLFEVTVRTIKSWSYVDGQPYIQTIDMEKQLFDLKRYIGK